MYVKSSHSHIAGGIWTEEKEKRSKSLLSPPLIIFTSVFTDKTDLLHNLRHLLAAFRSQLLLWLECVSNSE